MKIGVILLNYNSTEDCRKCISFLKRQEGVELDIIVVDNCSTPENRIAVEALCCATSCTIIPNDRNLGYNAGNNIGLRYAAGKGYEYALIANPDMEFPERDYVAKLVAKFCNALQNTKEGVSHPSSLIPNPSFPTPHPSPFNPYAVVASDIVSPDGVHQNPMERDGDWQESFGLLTGLFKKKPKDTYSFIDNYKESHECKKVGGCCFMIRLSFLEKIGFFDENVFLYCEEAILSRQVEQAGMKMYYTTDCQAVHNHVPSAKGDPIVRFKHWRHSRLYFISRYSGYPWYGKLVASISMRLYVAIMISVFKIRKFVRKG